MHTRNEVVVMQCNSSHMKQVSCILTPFSDYVNVAVATIRGLLPCCFRQTPYLSGDPIMMHVVRGMRITESAGLSDVLGAFPAQGDILMYICV